MSRTNMASVSNIVAAIADFHEWIDAEKAKSDSWRAVHSKELLYPDAEKEENRFTSDFVQNLRSHTHHFTGSSPLNFAQQHAAVAINQLLTNSLPEEGIYLPQDSNEIGFTVKHPAVGNITVNDDTNSYQERLRELLLSGVLPNLKNESFILEIGGGYGGLASAIKRAKPHCRYAIVDLPESLKFSFSFLSLLGYRCAFVTDQTLTEQMFSEYDFLLIPTDSMQVIPEQSVDLAINTLSFTEMPKSIVKGYGSHLVTWLTPNGMLFEQNNEYPEHCGEKFIQSTSDVFPEYFKECLELNRFSILGVTRLWSFVPLSNISPLNLTEPTHHEECCFALFGAGKTGETLLQSVGEQLNFSHFYDNDPKKWQTTMHNLHVHSPEQIMDDINTAKASGKRLVIVLSSYFYHEIYAQLSTLLSPALLAEHLIFINQLESYFVRGNT